MDGSIIYAKLQMIKKLTLIGILFTVCMMFIYGCSSKINAESGIAGNKEEIGDLTGLKEIYLAGGCFWGTQKYFDQFAGVVLTEVGYANGPQDKTSYERVCSNGGHAETVRIVYNDTEISLSQLLHYYFLVIDPLSVNQQGNDIGIQYRTGIYYTDESQLPEIQTIYSQQEEKIGQKLAVELEPLRNFCLAEEYHQKYLEKNPGGYCHIPKSYFELQEVERDNLRQRIGDQAYEVTQNGKTETAFSGEYDHFFEKGIYVDIVSGEVLFSSEDKFDSGCGWPAFSKPITEGTLKEYEDHSYGMYRIEVKSSQAGAHLGHVFPDGPKELGGMRYCINSAALRFIPYDQLEQEGYGKYRSLFGNR